MRKRSARRIVGLVHSVSRLRQHLVGSDGFRLFARPLLPPSVLCLALICSVVVFAQGSAGPGRGALVVEGGSPTDEIYRRFVTLAGGPKARIVVIPTAASEIKTDSGVILDPDWPWEREEWKALHSHYARHFGESVTFLHTRNRPAADSERFVEPLRKATGVWLGSGNAGRLAAAYLDTRTHRELEALLNRGGVIGGSSAGAIIQGSFTVRGRPDKPLLMAHGHTQGFGFLKNVAINPHLTEARRDNELINVCDAHPHVLGIGIDEGTALVVSGDAFEVIGKGRVAIYDNVKHGGAWYYWLKPGERFDLKDWRKLQPQ